LGLNSVQLFNQLFKPVIPFSCCAFALKNTKEILLLFELFFSLDVKIKLINYLIELKP
jgi:hypothetical protein